MTMAVVRFGESRRSNEAVKTRHRTPRSQNRRNARGTVRRNARTGKVIVS